MTCGKIGFATNSSKINGLVLIRQHALVSTQQGKEEAVWSSTSHRNNNRRSIKTGSRGLSLP
jgi:hypothetical protein